jgi:iron complex outermembrane recepter protein
MVSRASRLVLAIVLVAAVPALVRGEASVESQSWFAAVAGADEEPATGPAPDAPPPPPPPSGDRKRPSERPLPRAFNEMIDNVVVSARKRQESIQRLPLSITAISGPSLKQLGARRIQDISQSVPNLQYEPTVGLTSARVNARGVGQSDPAGTVDPGVGLYVDGVFLPRAQTGLLALSDVERVEVLRGPQGTVFGRNTIGGAVNVVTKEPTLDFGGDAEIRLGNFDLFESRAALNVPLGERAAARLSLATGTRDGFEKDRLGGTDPNDDKLLGARGQLLLRPDDRLEILLAADTTRENRVLSLGKCLPVNGGMSGLEIVNPLVGFTEACSSVAQSSNPRRVETEASFLQDELETYGGSARISYALGQSTNLRSLTAIRGFDSSTFMDFDSTRIELIRPSVEPEDFSQTQLSQDFQLTSSALDGKFEYLVGLSGFKEKSDDELREGVLSRITADDIVRTLPGLDAATTADLIRGAQVQTKNRVDNVSYAVFAQGTYALSDKLSFTAGLRFTEDRRRLFRRGIALTPGLDTQRRQVQTGDTTTFFERSERFSDFAPSASLGYDFTDDVFGYASFSTGFKSGGFNGRAFPLPTDDIGTVEFDPEDLTTYELGVKAAFMDRRLVLNAAAFYTIYEDIQLSVVGADAAISSITSNIANAGESIITGGEIELIAMLLPNLQFRTAVGLLHDRFTDFDDAADPQAKDRHLAFLSSYQTSTSLEYTLPLDNLGTLTARTDWATRSRQFLDVTNSDSLESGKYGLLDARLALALEDGVTEVALFGRNLLDREYLVGGVDFSATFGQATRFVGPPRTYGIEIRRRY